LQEQIAREEQERRRKEEIGAGDLAFCHSPSIPITERRRAERARAERLQAMEEYNENKASRERQLKAEAEQRRKEAAELAEMRREMYSALKFFFMASVN